MGATAMLALTVVSTVASVAGGIAQASQQNALANAQAEQIRMQGEMSELTARSQAAEMLNDQTRLRAKQVAQGAAAGITLDSGSFLSVVASEASKAERDRQQVLRTGRINRAASEVSAAGYEAQGQYSKWGAWINAGTSLLKGGTIAMGIADKAGWFDSKPSGSSSGGGVADLAASGNAYSGGGWL